ncbi:Uncharacterized protein HZ326_13581 [Fusarium oxysporum f. sp. albedinis]|nr:Uncharacterized protein HZ326_13581 [Fusarium oxysporum f. sp. albedinis]
MSDFLQDISSYFNQFSSTIFATNNFGISGMLRKHSHSRRLPGTIVNFICLNAVSNRKFVFGWPKADLTLTNNLQIIIRPFRLGEPSLIGGYFLRLSSAQSSLGQVLCHLNGMVHTIMRTHDSILCSPTHERNFVPPSTAWSTPHSHPQLPLPTMIRPPTFSVKHRLPAHGGVRLY